MTKQTKQPERIDTEIDNMIGDLIKREATPADMSNFIHHLLLQTRQQTLEEVFDLLEAVLKEADGGFFGRRITLENMIVVLKTIKKSLLNQLKEK